MLLVERSAGESPVSCLEEAKRVLQESGVLTALEKCVGGQIDYLPMHRKDQREVVGVWLVCEFCFRSEANEGCACDTVVAGVRTDQGQLRFMVQGAEPVIYLSLRESAWPEGRKAALRQAVQRACKRPKRRVYSGENYRSGLATAAS